MSTAVFIRGIRLRNLSGDKEAEWAAEWRYDDWWASACFSASFVIFFSNRPCGVPMVIAKAAVPTSSR